MKEITGSKKLVAKPFLRWAGSKKKLVPELVNYWSDEYSRYIEPFVGSAQLFFSLKAEKSILGDTNQELIEAYLNIKENPEKLFDKLSRFVANKENYYNLRSLNPKNLNSIERSSRFICLNRFCFNGLYRTNLKGEFNVPFTRGNSGSLPTLEALKVISKKLKNVKLEVADFEVLIRNNLRKNDFIYMDPPYAKSNGRIFTQYGPHSFGLNDLQRMSDLLEFIDESGAKFVLSYAECDEAREYFSSWKSRTLTAQRNIAGFSKNRRKEKELIFTNI